jgi:hypothetical protein
VLREENVDLDILPEHFVQFVNGGREFDAEQ